MTKEQAIELCDSARKTMYSPKTKEYISDFGYALEIAIEALEAQHCEDAISRQAVLDFCVEYGKSDTWDFVRNLSSVTPTPKMGRWIPVSERLPKDHLDVLVYLSTNRMTIACYNSHRLPFRDKPIGWGYTPNVGYIDHSKEEVIAWMPLPKPYTGAKMEGVSE